MADSITRARQALEDAEDAHAQAGQNGAPAGVLEDLSLTVADAEAAYYRACDLWEPSDISGALGADGLVYSDADPGL